MWGNGRNVQNRCLLRISNGASSLAENSEMYRVVAYYKSQIALVVVREGTNVYRYIMPLLQIENRL